MIRNPFNKFNINFTLLRMKNWLNILVVFVLFSCGSKQNLPPKADVKDSSQQEVNPVQKEEYTVDYNNKDQYLGYGSILGKPIDTIMFADTVWFYCNKKEIKREASGDSYVFYKKITHWPKQVISAQGETIILLERSLGEPEGSDVVGFIFKNQQFIKRVVMNKYKWWNIENDKNYSVEELQEIIKDHPFE